MEAVLRARLRRWFSPTGAEDSRLEGTELALAALLVEMIRADYESGAAEHETAKRMLARHFGLSEDAATRLLGEGARAADRAVSLFEHTRALDLGLSESEKFGVIEALWETAYADGALDGHEDYLVHKVSELLHVRHSDLIRIKESVRTRLGNEA